MTIAEQIYEKLKSAPPEMARQVLDYLNALEAARREGEGRPAPRPLSDFIGILKDSPSFQGDAVEIQRALRAEWDRE